MSYEMILIVGSLLVIAYLVIRSWPPSIQKSRPTPKTWPTLVIETDTSVWAFISSTAEGVETGLAQVEASIQAKTVFKTYDFLIPSETIIRASIGGADETVLKKSPQKFIRFLSHRDAVEFFHT